jgi:hypothetical protein
MICPGNDKSYFFMQGKNIFRELIHPWDYERAMQYVYLLSKEDKNIEILEARLKIKMTLTGGFVLMIIFLREMSRQTFAVDRCCP